MISNLEAFANSAKELSRNPLGIIALFIVLVYGFACLLFVNSVSSLESIERLPLIWFVILFPVLVLMLFGWLVSKHHDKLYSPRDYRDDKSFLKTTQQGKSKAQSVSSGVAAEPSKQMEELMEYGNDFELVSVREKLIEKDLIARNLDYSHATSKLLVRHLAAAQVLAWFEKTYKDIFGSQIHLLRELSNADEGIANDVVLSHFNSVKEDNAPVFDLWDLAKYLNYLYNTDLIEEINGIILLTKGGAEFLRLLTDSTYAEEKSL